MQFRKTLEYDSIIQAYKDFESQFSVKNMRTNRIIGQTGLNLSDYVDVKGVEITVVLENTPEQANST